MGRAGERREDDVGAVRGLIETRRELPAGAHANSRLELTCATDRAELDMNRLELRFGPQRCAQAAPNTSWELVLRLPRLARWSDGLATCPLPDAGVVDADVCAATAECTYVSQRSFEHGEQQRSIDVKRARFSLDAWQPLGATSLDAICGRHVHLAGTASAKQDGIDLDVRFNVTARTDR